MVGRMDEIKIYLITDRIISYIVLGAPSAHATMRSSSSSSPAAHLNKEVCARAAAALWGLFAGDALAMPVHWYYDLAQLRSDFGQIESYQAPKPSFPDSIMRLSNTGGGGRGSDEGNLSVISV